MSNSSLAFKGLIVCGGGSGGRGWGGWGWRLFWESLEDFLTDPPTPQFILPFQNWFPHKFSLHIVKATPQPKPNPAEVHHILYL